jgi:ABC-type tungstate transport system substrate-binding protein
MAILSTGLAIMLGGYIKGGVAAIPLAAALAGATAAAFALKTILRRSDR